MEKKNHDSWLNQFLSIPVCLILEFTLHDFSSPSPAYHCRPAEHWLVGLQCCLVSVHVVSLCFCVLFLLFVYVF